MKVTSHIRPVMVAVGVLLAASAGVKAGAVLDWNAIAAQTILAGGRPGPSAILDFAVVHAAIHDAVQAYDKQFEPYAIDVQNADGSRDAAVARATRDLLVNRFPAQTASVDSAYTSYLTAHGLAADDPGVSAGQWVAAGIIALRANDGSFPTSPQTPFVGANVPGLWRPTPSYLPPPPPSLAPMAVPWAGTVTPFALVSSDQFRPRPPLALRSLRYAVEYDETKALGRDTSTARTPAQTQLAYFYADNFLAVWNRTLRGLAGTYLTEEGDTARLLALCWLGGGDGFIAAWSEKLAHPNWRPVTAIQEGNNDGNPRTAGDANWKPLINTPNYPDHCSGANTLSGVMTKMLALFFGEDEVTFTVTSNHPLANPNSRTYSRFSDMAADVVEVRILQGIHFRSADEAGRALGTKVARWSFHHILGPLHGGWGVQEDFDDDDL